MSTVGFGEAYASSMDVRLNEGLVVKVASLAGLALLKLIAWSDRQYERDAQDLGLIMKHYLDAGNQKRVYTEGGDCSDLLDEDFDYEKASAHVLGRDLSRLVTRQSRTVIEQALANEDQLGVGTLATAMVRNNANYYGNSEMASAMLGALRKGLTEH